MSLSASPVSFDIWLDHFISWPLYLFISDFWVCSLRYSCTVSTGSSWEALPDGRPLVCWQRDNGEDRQWTTPRPAATEARAASYIIITLWPWSRIRAMLPLPKSLVPTPNAKVSMANVELWNVTVSSRSNRIKNKSCNNFWLHFLIVYLLSQIIALLDSFAKSEYIFQLLSTRYLMQQDEPLKHNTGL